MRAKLAISLLSLLAGCPDRTIAGVPVEQGKVETKDIPAVPRRDVDILFLVDDSGSMKEEQESLKANFSRFIAVLESIDGGLPNIHLGVTTPNLGTSAIDGTTAAGIGTCVGQGEAGALRRISAGGPAFLADLDDGHGGRTRNYTGTLADAFGLIANVGTAGCGIEQHLEAVKRALDHNPANAGFLRPDAYLAVIVVADEDDCSLAQSTLFDGDRTSPTYGDVTNFRCTREGITCDSPGGDLDAVGLRQDCHPNFTSTRLTQTDRYVSFLKGLKADPLDVFVAGIVGDPGPFEIIKKGAVSVLKPSCTYTGPAGAQYAYPAVRTLDFLDQFPNRSTHTTICADDLSAGLTQIAAQLKAVVNDPCFQLPLLDADPVTPGPQYDCTVSEIRRVPNQPDQELRVIPQCTAGNPRIPCWNIVEDGAHCGFVGTRPVLRLSIERGGEIPTPDLHIKASCVTAPASGPVL